MGMDDKTRQAILEGLCEGEVIMEFVQEYGCPGCGVRNVTAYRESFRSRYDDEEKRE